jgi:ketosteroid isomerase-like protein
MARTKTKKKAAPKRTTKKKTAAKRTPAAKSRRVARPKPAARAKAPTRAAADPNTAMRALARHIVDVSLANDDEAILALYASTIESSEAGQPPSVGLDALRAKFAGWRSMTTDTSFEPRRVIVDGKVIVIEWVGRVTLAATGRQAELHEIAVHEIENGKIAREAFFYNPAALAG